MPVLWLAAARNPDSEMLISAGRPVAFTIVEDLLVYSQGHDMRVDTVAARKTGSDSHDLRNPARLLQPSRQSHVMRSAPFNHEPTPLAPLPS